VIGEREMIEVDHGSIHDVYYAKAPVPPLHVIREPFVTAERVIIYLLSAVSKRFIR
jgi:hypothetical protein